MSLIKPVLDLGKIESIISTSSKDLRQKVKDLEDYLSQTADDALTKANDALTSAKEIPKSLMYLKEKDQKIIKYEKTRIAMRYWLMGKNFNSAAEAMEYAASKHSGTRKDGITPEFAHQVYIAHYIRTLYNLSHPEETLITAFLHDVVEDYNVSLDEIENKFGSKVKRSVKLISKLVNGHKTSPEEYFHAMAEDPIASIVKGADRIHNFQTMAEVFTPQKQTKYIEECETYILPMIKKAKRNFPTQEVAYENIKHVLNCQIELLKLSLK